MPIVHRPPGDPIVLDPLPTSTRPCEEREHNQPLELPEFPPIEIVSIEVVLRAC